MDLDDLRTIYPPGLLLDPSPSHLPGNPYFDEPQTSDFVSREDEGGLKLN